jgi:hypothetical protein
MDYGQLFESNEELDKSRGYPAARKRAIDTIAHEKGWVKLQHWFDSLDVYFKDDKGRIVKSSSTGQTPTPYFEKVCVAEVRQLEAWNDHMVDQSVIPPAFYGPPSPHFQEEFS